MKYLSIGFGNYINSEKIIAIKKYGSAPSRHDVQVARDNNTLVDCTEGKGTHSVIYTADKVILSAAISKTLVERIERGTDYEDNSDSKG